MPSVPPRASLASVFLFVSLLVFACNALTGADELSSNECPGCPGVGPQPTSTSMDQTLPATPPRLPPVTTTSVDGSSPLLDATADTGALDAGKAAGVGSVRCGTTACSGTSPVCC